LTIDISGTETVETNALIVSGAGGIFINEEYARQLKLKKLPLKKPIIARNIDNHKEKRRNDPLHDDLYHHWGKEIPY
jgi:hypothetical protein